MEQYKLLYKSNVERVKFLKSAIGREDGTDMAKGIDDGMSEFSVMTDDSEILPRENILDLKIDEIALEPLPINGILNMEKPLDTAVQTFITIEFFNHATKHTDLAQGYNPDISSVFSFKNPVDEFYLKYLQQNHILVEVYIVKGAGMGKETIKIGCSKLPLSPLLD